MSARPGPVARVWGGGAHERMRRRPARGSYTPNQSDYLRQRYDGMQLEDRLSFGMSIDETHLCSRGGFKPNATIENNERYERVSLTGKRRPAAGGDGRRCRRSDEAIHGRRSARQHDAGYIGRREDDRRVSQGRNDGDRAAQRVGHTMAHRGHAAEAHPRQA